MCSILRDEPAIAIGYISYTANASCLSFRSSDEMLLAVRNSAASVGHASTSRR